MAFDPNKDYWWMSLHENFFATEELAYIEDEIPNGSIYVLFFIKLCLLGLKNKGLIGRVVADMFLPYSDVTLSKETKLDVKEVKNALSVLSRVRLIEIADGIIYIPLVDSMVGTHKAGFRKIESEKRRNRRAKAIEAQFQQLSSGTPGQMSGHLSDTTNKLTTKELKTNNKEIINSTTTTEVVAAVEPVAVDNFNLTAKIKKLEENGLRTSIELLATKYTEAELDTYIAWAQAAAKNDCAGFLFKALEGKWKAPEEYLDRAMCPVCKGTKYENYNIEGIDKPVKGTCSLCKGKGFIRKENQK